MFTLDAATFPFRDKGVRVPRLAEVLAAFPKLRMIVEVKQIAPSVVEPMLDALDRAGMRRSVLVASEHQEPLDEVRKLAPEIPTNFSYLESGLFIQAMGTQDANYRPPGDAVQIPRSYESWQLVTPESVAFAHRLGLEVHVWTVNDEAEMSELLDMGVDGLISDYPDRALDVVRSRAPLTLFPVWRGLCYDFARSSKTFTRERKNYEARHRSLDPQPPRCSRRGPRR
jgi:glycerophosphoryl diester phosphodiesterase